MQFDPENKIVKLCAEGMQLEAEGKIDEAHSRFQYAWDSAENDFEAFTAAHYLARNQKEPSAVLQWNLEALRRAGLVNDGGIKGHYPSVYLNVGKSYEALNQIKEASFHYQAAADYSEHLPPGKYGDMIKMGIRAALERTGTASFSIRALDDLVNKWCEQKDLRPLSLVLPAYVSNLGTENDRNKLVSALSYLSATRCLMNDEQVILDELIIGLSGQG